MDQFSSKVGTVLLKKHIQNWCWENCEGMFKYLWRIEYNLSFKCNGLSFFDTSYNLLLEKNIYVDLICLDIKGFKDKLLKISNLNNENISNKYTNLERKLFSLKIFYIYSN